MDRRDPSLAGQIELVSGPMFSGKTRELIRRLQGATAAGETVVALRPAVDRRSSTPALVSHDGIRFPAKVVASVTEAHRIALAADVVGIDELQFFPEDVVETLVRLKARRRRVIAAGLDLTFRREDFPTTARARRVADRITRLKAWCHRCGEPATLTQRLVDGRPAPLDDETIRIGSIDLYEARCERCYEAERAFQPSLERQI